MIRVVREVLEEWEGECVVRVSRSDGASVTPVARRLETAAGDAIARRIEGMGELPVGSAVLTPGGDLPVRFLMHVVLQSAEEAVTPAIVQRATANILSRAVDFGMESLALPPLGTHAGNLQAEEAAHSMAAAFGEHFDRGEPPRELHLIVESEYEFDVFDRILGAAV